MTIWVPAVRPTPCLTTALELIQNVVHFHLKPASPKKKQDLAVILIHSIFSHAIVKDCKRPKQKYWTKIAFWDQLQHSQTSFDFLWFTVQGLLKLVSHCHCTDSGFTLLFLPLFSESRGLSLVKNAQCQIPLWSGCSAYLKLTSVIM